MATAHIPVQSMSPRKLRHLKEDPVSVHQVVLESSGYSSKILSGLHELRTQTLLCDYKLIADGSNFPVHRAVMVACSDYFRAMLTGDMRESKADGVTLQGVTASGLETVVNFAYTGNLELNLDSLEEVLSAASHLQMCEAVELCCRFIEMATTVDNCVDLLNLAELYSLNDTRLAVRQFIVQHFEALADSSQYHKLTSVQLASLLEENSLKVPSEFRLFELVLKWVQHDTSVREKCMPELMRHLRLPLLSGEELVDKVSRVEVMHSDRECGDLLTEAKDYHIVVSKQPLLQTSRTQVRSVKKSLVMCHAENLESYDFQSEGRHAFLRDSPMPLYNPCVCVVDNFMYACGGKYDSSENNEIATARCFRYDPRFDSWYELASMNEARKDFVMVAVQNVLYAIAGQDENMVMCTVETFSIAKNDWETRESLNRAVYGHAGAICDERIYISGGQKYDGHCNSVLSYNKDAMTWTEETPLLTSRSNHNMIALGEKLYVIGGSVEDSYGFPIPTTSIEIFCTNTRAWTVCDATLNIREAGVCALDKKIFIVGGINGAHYYSDLIQCYNPEKKTVETVDKFPTRIYGKACCILRLPQYV